MTGKIDIFEDLQCYRVAREFRGKISRLANTLPKVEVFKLKDQIIRASRSVTANIAEGFGRQHPQENLQFCRQARGSLMEVLDHLNVAFDEKYISQDEYATFRKEWFDVKGLLGGYISYLEKRSPRDRKFTDKEK